MKFDTILEEFLRMKTNQTHTHDCRHLCIHLLEFWYCMDSEGLISNLQFTSEIG